MIEDFFRIALNDIRQRKLRSWLTMVGVFIGIAAVVGIITVGNGLQAAIDDQFAQMGYDKIMVMPSGSMPFEAAKPLTTDDVDLIESVKGVYLAAPMTMKLMQVKFRDETIYTYVAGIPTDERMRVITDMQQVTVADGRNFKSTDTYKVLLTYRYTTDLFRKPVEVGNKIQMGGVDFDVVGTMETIGNPEDDRTVWMPIDTSHELFEEPTAVYAIIVQTKEGVDIPKVAEDITRKLRKYKDEREGEESFDVQTSEEMIRQFNQMLDIVQVALVGLAAISLIVGAIGIMNTMYTSVLERTREIGIMKAVGARNSHILTLFLIEAGSIGLVGGIIGIILGYGIAKAVEAIAVVYGAGGMLLITMSPTLTVQALLISFILGAISGVLPAREASKLRPVEALRYAK